MKKTAVILLSFLAFFSIQANNNNQYQVIIKNHKFTPKIIEVPANQKFKLEVINEDDTVEEFDSISLRREKIIPGKSKAIISLGPLKAGEYSFVGEFHENTAQGKIIVLENK